MGLSSRSFGTHALQYTGKHVMFEQQLLEKAGPVGQSKNYPDGCQQTCAALVVSAPKYKENTVYSEDHIS